MPPLPQILHNKREVIHGEVFVAARKGGGEYFFVFHAKSKLNVYADFEKLHLTFLDESRRAEEVWATPSYTTNRRHGLELGG